MKEPETDFTDFESEDFNYDDCQECQFCSGSDEFGHMQGCPESNNPFHQLLKDGYD